MRRVALDGATLFEERVTDVANGFGQKIARSQILMSRLGLGHCTNSPHVIVEQFGW
jgi:hypothetical protein